MTLRDRPAMLAALLLGVALLLAWLVYSPGLGGSFQLDDYSNLGPLDRLDDGATAQTYLQFLTEGIASPLGRPLSLLSFMAQAPDWPDHPAGFIRVNILLHLFNAVLLFWALIVLQRLRGEPAPARHYVPLAATVLWLLAPIHASTVLYVVQRMTELSATFVFLGLAVYLHGREALAAGATRRALALMSLGIAIGAGLGTLAKENAAQLPLMLLALEFTLLASLQRPRSWRLWAWPFLWAPALALLAYLAWVGITAKGYATRDFTLAERLLTEPRVLFLYLHKILAPFPSGIRLWYDDFPTSTGLLAPWTTAVALAALAAAAVSAWVLRVRAPLFAFAVLWFLACHVLESSTLSLEFVFDHRNYQASAGLWLAIACAAAGILQRASSVQARNVFIVLIAAYLALQAAVTWQIASLWGRPFELAAWMAQRLPDSKRAAQAYLGTLMLHQLPQQAAELAERSAARWPEAVAFRLETMQLSCQLAEIPFPPSDAVLDTLRTTPSDAKAAINSLDGLVSLLETRHCPVGLPRPISEFTVAALGNRAMQVQRHNLLLLHSRALILDGRREEGREVFRQASEVRPQMILLVQGVLDAVTDGDLQRARYYLDRAHSDPRIRWRERLAYRHDVQLLEDLVRSREKEPATGRMRPS